MKLLPKNHPLPPNHPLNHGAVISFVSKPKEEPTASNETPPKPNEKPADSSLRQVRP